MVRGASAQALAELGDTLGSVRTSDDATTGDELLGVAGVLRAEVALRRVVTDAAIEGAAKVGLVDNVFGRSVGDATMAVLRAAVQRRWTSSRDLADVLEHLGVMSVVRSAGAQGRNVSDELFAVAQVVDGDPDLRGALSDPARSAQDKGALLASVLGGKVLPATERLVRQAADGTHGALTHALDDYQHIAAEVQGETLAIVRTSRPLTEAEQKRLVDALGTQYDATVHLLVLVDPALVGGLRVEIRDDVIDGTVSGRLDDARRRLVG